MKGLQIMNFSKKEKIKSLKMIYKFLKDKKLKKRLQYIPSKVGNEDHIFIFFTISKHKRITVFMYEELIQITLKFKEIELILAHREKDENPKIKELALKIYNWCDKEVSRRLQKEMF